MTAPFFRQEVYFPCIKQAVLLMGSEKKKKFLCLFCWLFSGKKNCRNQILRFFLQVPWLAVSLIWQASISESDTYAHPQTRARYTYSMHAVPCNLLSPNYSRLEPMLLSLILSVQGLWGNSDISVWCLPYVSRALLGPIKLIFNVCPTLDGPSQGWRATEESWSAFGSALTVHSVVPSETCGRAPLMFCHPTTDWNTCSEPSLRPSTEIDLTPSSN